MKHFRFRKHFRTTATPAYNGERQTKRKHTFALIKWNKQALSKQSGCINTIFNENKYGKRWYFLLLLMFLPLMVVVMVILLFFWIFCCCFFVQIHIKLPSENGMCSKLKMRFIKIKKQTKQRRKKTATFFLESNLIVNIKEKQVAKRRKKIHIEQRERENWKGFHATHKHVKYNKITQ